MSSPTPPERVVLSEALGRDAIARWYAGKRFDFDWASAHFPNWAWLLRHLRSRAVDVLEIGSQEGRSALFFLNYLPKCRIACVDKFTKLEAHFDANLAEFATRAEKL